MRRLAQLLVRVFFRGIELEHLDRLPPTGPVPPHAATPRPARSAHSPCMSRLVYIARQKPPWSTTATGHPGAGGVPEGRQSSARWSRLGP